MPISASPQTIAIIGAGASGTLLATQLLRRAVAPLRVRLIERTGDTGRGVAYSTRCADHLLTVPAGRMGAFPDDPGHFLRWVEARLGQPGFPAVVTAQDYLPRSLFGDYLRDVLATARAAAPSGVDVVEEKAEIVDIENGRDAANVMASDGRVFVARRVVLAIGNLPGEYPILRPLPVYQSPRYVHIPWRGDVLAGIGPDDAVLLVGQGPLATDLIVQLAQSGHRGPIHALSRHGIRPQAHRLVAHYNSFLADEAAPTTLRALVRRVRAEVRDSAARGVDWRAVIDGLRPYSQAIWQSLSWDDRARFMRFVRPFWEAHRHRLAPQTAAELEKIEATGRLKFYAGRLQVLEANENGVQALLRRRGTIQHVALQVAKVINCTGSRTDYSKYQHPLFIHLLARGLIDHDPLALGINALPTGEVLRYRGEPQDWLFTLGAPMKSVLWETTAIAEIRVQAASLAKRLLSD